LPPTSQVAAIQVQLNFEPETRNLEPCRRPARWPLSRTVA